MQRPEALERSGSGDQWLVEADGPQLRAMLGTLLHSAPLGIGLWDDELRFVFVNDALAEMNGLPAADHVGRTVAEVVPGVAEEGLAALRHVLETGEPLLDLEIVGETPAQPGVERSWSESLYRVQLDDHRVGVAAIVLETTDQRRADTERRSATRRLVALSDFANTLALADTTAAVAAAVLAHVPAAVDADFVTLALRGDAERSITFVHPPGLDPEVAERYTSMPLDVPSPLTDAVRTGEIVVVPSFEENAERYPDLVDDTLSSGLVSVAAAPLCKDDGTIGAIGFGWRHALPEDDVTEARLVVIADLTAQTLERTRAADLRAGLVDELQRHLVPDQPERPGLEIAVRYQAAGRSIGFGGDWYDIVALDEGTVAAPAPEQIGYLTASAGSWSALTVAQNIDFVAGIYGLGGAELETRRAELLTRAGLTAASDRLASQLSGGMRRKLGFSMAMVHRPRLLVLDEPSTGVDPVSRIDLWRLVTQAAASGAAVLMSTTYLDEAERAASLVVLDRGRVLAQGSWDDVRASFRGSVTVGSDAVRPEWSWRRGRSVHEFWPPGSDVVGTPTAPDLEDVVIALSLERRHEAVAP